VCLSGSAPFICMKSMTVCNHPHPPDPRNETNQNHAGSAHGAKLCPYPHQNRETITHFPRHRICCLLRQCHHHEHSARVYDIAFSCRVKDRGKYPGVTHWSTPYFTSVNRSSKGEWHGYVDCLGAALGKGVNGGAARAPNFGDGSANLPRANVW
jgi:hypothetical protein